MPRVSINKLITKDPVGLNYLEDIRKYSCPLDIYLSRITQNINHSNLLGVLNLGFLHYTQLLNECNELKNNQPKNSLTKFNRLALLDLLYLNGKYTFWNCFINNGSLENLFVSAFTKQNVDVIESLEKLSQKYKNSIFSETAVNLKDTKRDVDAEFELKAQGVYQISENIDKYYFYFIKLQKLFSSLNKQILFPLFSDISKQLKIPNYCPSVYGGLIQEYKKYSQYTLSPGITFINKTVYDFKNNKLLILDTKLNKTLKQILKKNKLTLYSTHYKNIEYLGKKQIIKSHDLNSLLKNKYEKNANFLGTLHLELSNTCNFNCTHCFNRYQKREKTITFNDYKKIIDWFATKGKFYVVLFGGEPFLNPNFDMILKYLNKKQFVIEVFTNASLLTSEKLKQIKNIKIYRYRISLEGSKKINDRIRGVGAYYKTLRGIRLIKKYSVAPIHLNVTLSKDNLGEIDAIFDIAKKEKVDGIGFGLLEPIGKASVNTKKLLSPNDCFFANDRIKNLSKKTGIVAGFSQFCENPINNKKRENLFNNNSYLKANPCGIGYSMFYVRDDGYIVPCPELTDKKFGTHFSKLTLDTSLDDLFPKKINLLRYVQSPCNNCSIFYVCFGSCKAKIYTLYGSFLKCDKYEKKRYSHLFFTLSDIYG